MQSSAAVTTIGLQVHDQKQELVPQFQVNEQLASIIVNDVRPCNELNWLVSHLSKLNRDAMNSNATSREKSTG